MATASPSSDVRYPIGQPDRSPSPDDRAAHIRAIGELPVHFAAVYSGLSDEALDTPYREGGWTLRQLAHHVSDSHMQAFCRTKRALTEDWPTIQPYDEKLWAGTGEVRGPVEAPLGLLTGLHPRWVALLQALTPAQWEHGVVHPERGRLSVAQLAALYAWHGRHHTAHGRGLRDRMGW